MFLHNIPHLPTLQTLPMSASTPIRQNPFPCHFSIQIIHLLHRPQSTMQKTPCPLSELSHPRTPPLIIPKHLQAFRLPISGALYRIWVGYSYDKHWAIVSRALSKRRQTTLKRHQTPLETPPNHPWNATKILLLIPHIFSLKEKFCNP